MTDYRDITIALAGICQAAALVNDEATLGETQNITSTLQPLLVIQPENTLAVFGGSLANVRKGLETLRQELTNPNEHITRYWLSLIALQGKLYKSPETKSALAERIARLPEQLRYYDNDMVSQGFLKILAGIYSDLLSPLGNPIKVLGVVEYLQNPDIQARIRALLLSGVRSAVLWQQVGGKRWQLLFCRKKILATAEQLLTTID